MVSSKAPTVAEYLRSLPDDRRKAIAKVRAVVKKNLPKGYAEGMQYGMIGWYIPLSRFPDTYNGQPLALAGLASQKNGMSLYMMGPYGNTEERARFVEAWRASGKKKLDMGKSCIRFKSVDDLALDVIGDSIARTTVERYLAAYEAARALTKGGQKKKAPKK